MSNNLSVYVKDIADAIRTKTGSSSLIDPQDFPTEIANIPSGGTSKLLQVVDRTVTTITAEDLAGATSIGDYAFRNCNRLTSVNIPDGVTDIGANAFFDCQSLMSITIPDSVTGIRGSAFSDCINLTSVFYTGDIASWCGIDLYNYYSNPLYYAHNLYINNTLVTEITIPDTVTGIKAYVFAGWNGTSITIPASVTSMGDYAFGYCSSLTSVTIGSGVTSIGGNAFGSCTSLTSITIPDSVTSIGNSAFSGCSGLTSVTVLRDLPPTLGGTSVFNNTNNCPIYVPSASVYTYKSASRWSSLSSRIQAIPS